MQNFRYCYDGQYTGLDTLINIDGYYDFAKEKTVHIYLLFYKDGIYAETDYTFYKSYFKGVDNNRYNGFQKYGKWGRYFVCGDTIKLQSVDRPAFGGTTLVWWVSETWYKILDKNTITGIYPSKKPVRYPDDFKEQFYMKRYGRIPAKFIPITTKPDSNDCWIKKKKWFWCNEEDWKKYKKSKND